MTPTATMSSMTVSVRRKTRSCVAIRGPTMASAPSITAVSVPITTPQAPFASPGASRTYRAAGTTRPPTAAITGMAARRGVVSAPMENSRRTSRPIMKKNRAIRPSFTHWPRGIDSRQSPTESEAGVDHSDR